MGLTKKLIKVTNDLKKEKEKSSDNVFNDAGDEKVQSPMISSNEFETKLDAMQQSLTNMESKWGNDLHLVHQKMDDIRPKLVRLKTRRDFASEQTFVDYICNKLENWDANKFGPVLVRVQENASGKAKHFIGYVGEPQKWNHTICKVQWFGLGKKLPEAIEWKALDVFLPLSSFYYPDCPHARAYGSRNDSKKQQL